MSESDVLTQWLMSVKDRTCEILHFSGLHNSNLTRNCDEVVYQMGPHFSVKVNLSALSAEQTNV